MGLALRRLPSLSLLLHPLLAPLQAESRRLNTVSPAAAATFCHLIPFLSLRNQSLSLGSLPPLFRRRLCQLSWEKFYLGFAQLLSFFRLCVTRDISLECVNALPLLHPFDEVCMCWCVCSRIQEMRQTTINLKTANLRWESAAAAARLFFAILQQPLFISSWRLEMTKHSPDQGPSSPLFAPPPPFFLLIRVKRTLLTEVQFHIKSAQDGSPSPLFFWSAARVFPSVNFFNSDASEYENSN